MDESEVLKQQLHDAHQAEIKKLEAERDAANDWLEKITGPDTPAIRLQLGMGIEELERLGSPYCRQRLQAILAYLTREQGERTSEMQASEANDVEQDMLARLIDLGIREEGPERVLSSGLTSTVFWDVEKLFIEQRPAVIVEVLDSFMDKVQALKPTELLGIPTGGLRLARLLSRRLGIAMRGSRYHPWALVDDVLTTGSTIREYIRSEGRPGYIVVLVNRSNLTEIDGIPIISGVMVDTVEQPKQPAGEVEKALVDMVQQHCFVDQEAGQYLDSMALAANANAMRVLAERGLLVIDREYNRRVIAHWFALERAFVHPDPLAERSWPLW